MEPIEVLLAQELEVDGDVHRRHDRILFRARTQFATYEPTRGEPSFLARLSRWLEQAHPEHHEALHALVDLVGFVDESQQRALFGAAIEEQVVPWVLAELGLDAFSEQALQAVSERLGKLCYLPLSDSLRINAFVKQTGLRTTSVQPDLLALAELDRCWEEEVLGPWVRQRLLPLVDLGRLGVAGALHSFLVRSQCMGLVVLDDFVGSGEQAIRVLRFLARLRPDLPVLLVPLVAMPAGVDKVRQFLAVRGQAHVTVRPACELEVTDSVLPSQQEGEAPTAPIIRAAIDALSHLIDLPRDQWGQFGLHNAGGLTVLYSNVPDTTVPLLHTSTSKWRPLFPRVER